MKILEDWRTGANAVWELPINCVEVNKELNVQVSVNQRADARE